MTVCPQVTVECPECGHTLVAVQEAQATCTSCGAELAWTQLSRDRDGVWRSAPAARP